MIFYNNVLNFVFCFMLFFLIAFSTNLKIFDRINGVSSFVLTLEKNNLQNINFLVIEDRLLYSSISYHLRGSDKNILTPHNPIRRIKSQFQISQPLKAKHGKNFIFIGNLSSLNYLEKNFQVIKKEKINVKFVKHPIEIYEVVF